MYPEYGETDSKQFEVTGHDGVFIVRREDVEEYLAIYNPLQLRDNKSVKVDDRYSVMNMGESKGLTFDRVLIYPTKPMKEWMKNNSKELKSKSKSQFYVALTRAKYSVGIVFDYEDNDNIEGISKYK